MSAKAKIHILKGDITDCRTDAIVNAANTDLWLGSGVAGAIRSKGGPSIQKECDEIGPIEMGEAAVTGGGDLPCKYVIHAASMSMDHPTSDESLYDSVKNSLLRAAELECKSMAFPAIGTGVSEYDPQRCAEIMLGEINRLLPEMQGLDRVELVLLDDAIYQIFKTEYDKL
jgi:Predicted phosphatase homologous to the C-terminal domain of histone macroH2A1